MTAVPAVAAPLHALLARAIDYAGLFPPAGLDLGTALRNYSGYRKGEEAWALGRFIIPAEQLEQLPPHAEPPIGLSVVVGPQVSRDLARVEAFHVLGVATNYPVQALEIKGPPPRPGSDPGLTPIRYFEIPLEEDELERRIEAIRSAGGLAKVRTGGTSAGAFPSSGSLTRFLLATARGSLPFKATAGLHHPLRGSFRLAYEADSPSGVMYGYLNLAIAAMLAWGGAGAEAVEAALLESDPGTVRFDAGAIWWRAHRFPADLLLTVRKDFFHGFGSCSFREPLDELVPFAPVR